MEPIIKISNLERYFLDGDREFYALKGINLEVKPNECLILEGVSGSGKTTLLSIIAGLERPSSGDIIVNSERIAKLPDKHLSLFRSKHIGVVFQHYNLIEYLTVEDNVLTPLIPQNLPIKEAFSRVKRALELANISHKKEQLAGVLSGGEKQRVAIARALCANPEIIICDEPTANLDKSNALRFLEILKELYSLGKTIIIATHDPIFKELDFNHRVIKMQNGSIVEA